MAGDPSFALSKVKDKYSVVAPLLSDDSKLLQCSAPVTAARGMLANNKPLFELVAGPAKHQVKV